jgi:flavodoxin
MKIQLIKPMPWVLLLIALLAGCTQTSTVSREGKQIGKVLIVYYSWSGNTHELALQLQKKTGGDLCRLETQKKYLPFPEIYQEAKEEIKNGYLPELITPIPDIDDYDLILIGSPVWWYSVAPAVLTLLSQCDFKGKPVALFSTHEGDLREFDQTFETNVKNARILPSKDFNVNLMKNKDALEEKISLWIKSLEDKK